MIQVQLRHRKAKRIKSTNRCSGRFVGCVQSFAFEVYCKLTEKLFSFYFLGYVAQRPKKCLQERKREN